MSNIEWTDATWNPVIGCTPVSSGCLNCYAATMARRLEAMGKKEYQPREWWFPPSSNPDGTDAEPARLAKVTRIAEVRGGRAVFTGEVRTLADRLAEPLHWRKPRRVFVNSMSDLFHEAVPFEFIDRVFAVMALCLQHTFQVLTKRPERMAEYLNTPGRMDQNIWRAMLDPDQEFVPDHEPHTWPLPNVWLGTSVENQTAADERIPHLLRCPARVRFLSVEPLLDDVDLTRVRLLKSTAPERGKPDVTIDCLRGWYGGSDESKTAIDWVIVGGESGAGARPCDVAWIRSVVGQCRGAGVPCFLKQLGARPVARGASLAAWASEQSWHITHEGQDAIDDDGPLSRGPGWAPRLRDRKGGDPAEWPEDLRVREWPQSVGTP